MTKSLAELTEHRFISFDRTPIFYRQVSPGENVLATVVIIHGMGEHGGRYLDFASYLACEGYRVTLPDLRGFGLSGGQRGCLNSFEEYFRDLDVVIGMIKQRQPRTKIFLMGHSYGGLVGFHYAIERPEISFSGLILTSPNFGITIKVPYWKHVLALFLSRLAPNFIQLNRVNPAYLSHDRKAVLKYRTDKLVHPKISIGLYRHLTAHMKQSVLAGSRLNLPALFLQAGDDRIVSREATENVFKALVSPDKSMEIYEGFYHEILNEESSGVVYERILAWLDQQIKS